MFTPQTAEMIEFGPTGSQSQEPGNPSELCKWISGALDLGNLTDA